MPPRVEFSPCGMGRLVGQELTRELITQSRDR